MVTFSPTPVTGERGQTTRTLDHGIVAIDAGQHIVAFDSVAESLLGLAASDVLARSLEALPGPVGDALLETLRNGQSIPERQVSVPQGQLPALILHVSTTATRGADGQPLGAIGVLSDPNRAGGLDHKLRQIDRLASLGTLSAGIAHEIKNALVAVRTFVDLLIAQSPETKFAELVSREIRRIDTLVSQMLRFSRSDRAAYSRISVHEVLQQSLELLHRELPERQIALHCSLEANPDAILGDPCQLEQAFINIVFNALEAMGSNGRLSVASSIAPAEEGGKSNKPLLQISIADTGPGIPPEIQDRLFDPFFTTKANGSGLGLAITRQIVQEHGGTIRVDSRPSSGTTFFLCLPLADPA